MTVVNMSPILKKVKGKMVLCTVVCRAIHIYHVVILKKEYTRVLLRASGLPKISGGGPPTPHLFVQG